MTKTTVPSRRRDLDSAERLLIRLGARLQRIEAPLTTSSKKRLLRDLILNDKMIWMVLNKCMIIGRKAMNGNKIFIGFRNIKDII
jgi:hypothetical protein